MSFYLKLFLLISFLYNSSTQYLNQSPNYDNLFLYDNFTPEESDLNDIQDMDIFPSNFRFSRKFIPKLIELAVQFLLNTSFISPLYVFDPKIQKCFKGLNYSDNETFIRYTGCSGKYLNDLGNEQLCIDNRNKNKTNSNASEYSKGEYFLVRGYFENTIRLTNDEDRNLLEFLNQNYFSVALCLPSACYEMIEQLMYHEKPLLDYIFENLNVSNLTYITHTEASNSNDEKYKNGSIFLIILYLITFIKFIVGLFRIIFLTKGYERYYVDKIDEEESKELINKKEEEENIKSSTKSLSDKINDNNDEIKERYVDYIYGNAAKKETNLYNPFYDNQDKYPLKMKIIKYLDLFDNIKTLITMTNKYYNSCNIQKIYFLKFITMFMSIVLSVMITQTRMPTKNFLVYSFYQSFLFFLIKICVFSSVFWIVLDAVTTGFKLMSYIKKKIGTSDNSNLQFVHLLKFLLLLIPKIFLFIICFFALHIYSNHLTYSLSNKNYIGPFILYKDLIHNYTYSVRESDEKFFRSFKYLIPIWINYIDYFKEINLNKQLIPQINGSEGKNPSNASNYTYYQFEKNGYEIPSPFLTNTDLFINVYLNEFILLLFMIFITYLSYKIRRKLFDYALLLINIFLYIIPAFNWTKYEIGDDDKNSPECRLYSLQYVLGQYFSEKYTHYMINFYYFGFIIGVIMFYHNENMYLKLNKISHKRSNSNTVSNSSFDSSENSINNLLEKLPFSFCIDIIMALNKLKFYIKRIIFFICLLFIFLLSTTFYLLQKYKKADMEPYLKNSPIKEIKKLCLNHKTIKFLFLYEKNLCCIFFFILILIFIVYPSNTSLVKFSQLNFFIIFDRISFSFYCTYFFLVYSAFCVFYVEFKITHINVFLHSLGLFIIIITINIFFVCIFELPIRMMIKSLMNKNVDKEFRMSFASGGLISNRMTSIK